MKKHIAAIVAAGMVIASLAGCGQDGDDIPEAVMEKATHVYRGDYLSVPESVRLRSERGVTVGEELAFFAEEVVNPGDPETGEGYESREILYYIPTEGGEGRILPLPTRLTGDEEARAYISTATAGGDGRYAVAERMYYKNGNAQYRLTVYGADGAELWSIDPEPLWQEREGDSRFGDTYNFYIRELAVGAAGQLYVATETSVIALSAAGEKLYEVGFQGYMNALYPSGEQVLCAYTDYADQYRGDKLCPMDDGARGFGEAILPPAGVDTNATTALVGPGHDIYLQNNTGLYFMDEGDAAPTLLCDWLNSDIDANAVRSIQVLGEDSFLYVGSDPMDYELEVAILRRIPDEEVQPRYLIRMALTYMDYGLSGAVLNFNRSQETYRVVIEDYSQYNTEEDYQAGQTKLREEILAGETPDILFNCPDSVFAVFRDKGVFADLYAYLDADSTVNRETLLPCVTEAYESGGKLYTLPTYFRISGFGGKAANLAAYADHWTVDRALDAIEAAEAAGGRFYTHIYREGVEGWFITYALSSYIDWEAATCDFDSDTFIRVLTYLRELPTQEEFYEEYDQQNGQAQDLKDMRENIMMVTDVSLFAFYDYIQTKAMLGGEDLALLGIPTKDGGALPLEGSWNWSISAKSPVKDGAWEVIRFMLSDEMQISESARHRGFSATKSGIRAQAEEEMTMYYAFRLDGSGWGGTTWDGITPPDMEIDPETEVAGYLTQADVDQLMEILENGRFLTEANLAAEETLLGLIKEELGALYAGNASPEETAKKIQSRVGIYLGEHA